MVKKPKAVTLDVLGTSGTVDPLAQTFTLSDTGTFSKDMFSVGKDGVTNSPLARRDLGAAARRPRPGAAARQGRVEPRVPRDAPADAAAARAQGAAGPRARAGGAPLAGERDEGGVQRAERPPRRLLRRLPPRGRRLPRARVHGRGLAARRVRERRARGGARARAAARAHPLPDPAGAHVPPPRAPRRPPRPQAGEHPAQRRGLRQALRFWCAARTSRGAQFVRRAIRPAQFC